MKLIVDTCTFLWLASAEEKRSALAKSLFKDSGNTLLLSSASVWEIGVKHALGRLPLPNNLTPAEFIPEARARNGVDPLPITEDDALHLTRLPRFHQDPFDRMPICQAIVNQAVIITPDRPRSSSRAERLGGRQRSAQRTLRAMGKAWGKPKGGNYGIRVILGRRTNRTPCGGQRRALPSCERPQ